MPYLLDTNLLIERFRGSNIAERVTPLFERERFSTTVLNATEVFKWLEREGQTERIEDAIQFVNDIPFEEIVLADAVLAGKLASKHKLYLVDAILLAVCLNHQLTLLTMDSDFEKVKGIGAKIQFLK